MLARFKRFLDQYEVPKTELPPHSADDRQLACAALLVEAARLDEHFGPKERARVHELLKGRFGLGDDEAAALTAEAERTSEVSVEWQSLTRTVKDAFGHDERVEMVEMLWEVAYADGELHDYEASLLRRIAPLLYVSDRESGEARRRVVERLGITDTETAPVRDRAAATTAGEETGAAGFALDPRLADSTAPVGDLPLCRVLLVDDRRFPWLLLVPRRPDVGELADLEDAADRHRLADEIHAAAQILRRLYRPARVNVGAIGNKVPQLHVHLVARVTDDAAWPEVVWGSPMEPCEPDALAARREELVAAFRAEEGFGGIRP